MLKSRIVNAGAAVLLLAVAASRCAAAAEMVAVANPWVRATVAGQSVAAAYVDLTAGSDAALVAASSPVAARAELHTMRIEGGVMKMRPLKRIELPANRTVSLKPGGDHLMLLDIKRALKPGERVPLALTVQDAKGVKSTLRVEAEVRTAAAAEHGHSH